MNNEMNADDVMRSMDELQSDVDALQCTINNVRSRLKTLIDGASCNERKLKAGQYVAIDNDDCILWMPTGKVGLNDYTAYVTPKGCIVRIIELRNQQAFVEVANEPSSKGWIELSDMFKYEK